MSDFRAIRILQSLLKSKDKWYLELYVPEGFELIGQKAKLYADKKLSKISLLSLWKRYKVWVKSDPQMRNCDDYFHAFIAAVAFDFAMDVLNKEEKIYFDNTCYFTFKFTRL